MSVLPTVPLGEVARFVRGITFKPEDVVPVGGEASVACMRTKNVQVELDLADVWGIPVTFVKREDQFLVDGDLLVSSANSWNLVGKCCWVPPLPWRATFGGFISVLRADRGRLDPRYLYHWFSSANVQAIVRSFGQQTTNISNLNVERCLRLEVPLPTLDEQRRIAAVLDQADALRTKRRAALAHLDALAQSIFLEMFGDPATNPKGWPTARLGDVVAVNPRVSSQAVLGEHSADSLVAFVPMAAVSESKRRVTDYEMRAIGEVAKGYTPFQRDDVLLAKITPCFENGKLCWVRDLPTAIGFGSTEFHVFRAPDPCVARFVFSLLSLPDLRERGARAMKGAAGQKRVPADFFADMKIPTPPASLLAQLDAKCAAIDLLRDKASTESVQLTDLFESLQHRAFRGEL